MRNHILQNFLMATVMLLVAVPAVLAEKASPPNFVILFADDLGYGDLSCYGHPTIRTPNLDRMAGEGMRFTQFYAAASVCTPSRAGLMTGRLPVRSGMCSDKFRVLFPDSTGGLPHEEMTIAEGLKTAGYATMCIGKWHLGHLPKYLPTHNGFDEYFGIPYSNDMEPCPLMRGTEVIEEPAVQETLTPRYTAEAVRFIKQHQKEPFFVYLPYTYPHVPLHASDKFKKTSRRGQYGDVVEELDWSVGQILQTLRDLGLAERTLVFFTSDNGPWLVKKRKGGSAGLLRDGKGSTWEGGMREPGLAWWPGKIKAGTITAEVASTMDFLPTCLKLAGVTPPTDRIIDGQDMAPILFGTGPGQCDVFFYYRGTHLMAVRKGPWKAHFMTQDAYGPDRKKIVTHDPPLLYNVERDPSEQYDLGHDAPDIVADIRKEVEKHKANLKPAPSQLSERIRSNN